MSERLDQHRRGTVGAWTALMVTQAPGPLTLITIDSGIDCRR